MPLESNFYAHDFTPLLIINTCTTCTFFIKHLCIFQYFLCFIVGISFIFFHAETKIWLTKKETGAFYKFTQLLRICHFPIICSHWQRWWMMYIVPVCQEMFKINQKIFWKNSFFNPTLKILVTNNLQRSNTITYI